MKSFWKGIAILTLTAVLLAGCGAAGNEGEKAAPGAQDETAGTAAAQEAARASESEEKAAEAAGTPTEEGVEDTEEKTAETLAPDATNLTYLEEYQIADFYGDGKEYALYAPKGGESTDGFFFYNEHGITFTASVYNCGSVENSQEYLQMYLEGLVDMQAKDWQENPECSEVGVGEMLEKGDDRYLFLTAKAKDVFGTPYQKKKLMYMSVREGGAGVFWDMEASEYAQDEETAPLIKEVARCYGLDLNELAIDDGAWADQNAQREADRQDVYEPEEGDPVLEKVEGYQYLGMLTLALDEEGKVTCPVLAPMGWNTTADESRVSTTIHGVSVRLNGYQTGTVNYQAMAQEEAEGDLRLRSDPEEGNRNVRISDVMPMQEQEAGVYYVLEYEEQDYATQEYYKRADITCIMQVKEKHFVTCRISLISGEYDSATNSLIKELETAYGLDLSEWYAVEELPQTKE